jgi:hypothetical protein
MRILLVAGVLLGTLALFNPDEEDFRSYVTERANEAISDRARSAGGSIFSDIVGSVGGTLAGHVASRTVRRDEYYVFSVYTIDLDGPQRRGEEWRFLGLAKQFVPLHTPDSLGG